MGKDSGKALFSIKDRAIENCAEYGLGVVLVPTLIKGLNTDEIGYILDFAVKKMPFVRGVHFQPVSFLEGILMVKWNVIPCPNY